MSLVGDGADAAATVAAQVDAGIGLDGARNPFGQTSRPPSIHDADSSSSDKSKGEIWEARRRRKEKMKAKIEKKAKKLMMKRIKEESEKHPFFRLNQVPHNYASSQYPTSQFQSVHLGKPPLFDGLDYPMWSYDMKMHLYGLHSSIWEVVVVVVTPPTNGVPMAEQDQDYFRNAEAVRVITSSLCAQEFNKVRNIEIAKKIWDTLREAHVGTIEVREGTMDLLQEELEHFIMQDEKTVRQIYDRLMVLVSDIRSLGSTDGKITR
jgi:hypothetical protein